MNPRAIETVPVNPAGQDARAVDSLTRINHLRARYESLRAEAQATGKSGVLSAKRAKSAVNRRIWDTCSANRRPRICYGEGDGADVWAMGKVTDTFDTVQSRRAMLRSAFVFAGGLAVGACGPRGVSTAVQFAPPAPPLPVPVAPKVAPRLPNIRSRPRASASSCSSARSPRSIAIRWRSRRTIASRSPISIFPRPNPASTSSTWAPAPARACSSRTAADRTPSTPGCSSASRTTSARRRPARARS